VLTDTPSPVDASFVAPGRYLSWPINSLRHFIEKRPDLRTTLLELANRDLAEKLERSLAAGA
jgi:hypothetical protein